MNYANTCVTTTGPPSQEQDKSSDLVRVCDRPSHPYELLQRGGRLEQSRYQALADGLDAYGVLC